MPLSKADIDTLAEYDLQLNIQHKTIKGLGTQIPMDGAQNINNVFLEETLVALAQGLRDGEVQFEDYKKRGIIVADKEGNYNLADKHAKTMGNDSVVVKDNE